LTDTAADDPASGGLQRISEAVGELLALHALFDCKRGGERSLLYAQCIPWLSAVRVHARPPLPVKEITALTREVDWHLRSLAGLGMGKSGQDEQHAAWALGGLMTLARCIGRR
jgi:hypothetical protein